MAKSAAVVVTHGGAHSVSRALVAGVPQVILATSPENWFYVNALERFGVGKGVDRKSQLRDALDRVLSDPGYGERARALAIDCRKRHVGNTFEIVADRIAQVP
jgi:UDP:flavonoid glycosyltransferase YjiC (YdhE family)